MEDKYSIEEAKSIRIGIITMLIIMVVVFITISHNATIKKEGLGNTYNIYADFGRTDGLSVGDVVRMSGVTIGRVVGSKLDENFNSHLTLEIGSEYSIPDDSSASIVSFGLIGGKYVEIDVGGSEDFIKSGDTLSYTQDAMVLEELLERLISMGKSKKSSNVKSKGIENSNGITELEIKGDSYE
ncbi:MAG: MCE family protein [Alphaproteobacteria bacterium]|nr:MCE family protein [Alphaproteobacteria bacterium]